jgi:PAS domain S-box-containing protein
MTLPPVADTSQSGTLLTEERHVLELIATGAGLDDVLDALCRLIDEQSGLTSSVFLLDRTGRQMTLAAGPHLPNAWRQTITSLSVTPTNTACGAAVSSRGQVIVTDVATSPLFAQWRDAARLSRIASVWSTPFFSKDGDVLGTFGVLSHEPRRPDEGQLRLVDRATHLASIAVERHQTEEGLRESERRFSTAFYSSPACMTIHRFGDGRFLYVNDTFMRMFGYSRAEVVGQTALGLGLWADPSHRAELLRLLNEHGTAREFDAKARTKSGEVLDLLVWMARIQILGEECVLGITCDISARKRAEKALAQSERLLRVVLNTLPVGVAVVDIAGNIILSNPASRRIWGDVIHSGPERYARSKAWWRDTGKEVVPEEWASVRARVSGETSVNEVVDIEAFDGVRKVVQNSAAPIRDTNDRITGAVIVNEDISARTTAERERNDAFMQMRTLTGRLMRAQDDERRRIAQMLHETTAQDLAALKMHLARLTRTGVGLSDADRAALRESIDLAERSMTEIRTLSYLLHPPFLDEVGLLSALRWYASGFAERSGIEVDLDLPSTFDRLPQEVETALFRVVQEALINIHHHAESPTALIRLRVDGHRLTLEIEDRGRGMSSEAIAQLPTGGGALGVGVAGMRERLQQLGGTLDIESSAGGTTVCAQIPLPPDAP